MVQRPSELKTPYKTSEFKVMTDAITGLDMEIHDGLLEIAADLRKLLPKARGSKLPTVLRPDLVINARRVARHLTHAAALHEAAAKSERRAYVTYLELFTSQGSTGSHARGFNVDG